ncbi:trehalose operon repressor [Rothia sp. ZJ1223]|uniref:trehalose operon repressor n=1 Tax=Rothia sp. ZJ1223 TaxID=2811098 RepID=UPI001959180C|nr:trehalose operon repressor [Rothia sp. ZJ1223]MBM7052127.1 trehalose operon repressor [Rothia sp. ZJ1223]
MANKYQHVASNLTDRIESGEFQVGTLLPSEKHLAAHYQVSRETTRKALALLTDEGRIQKMVGKGSIVISPTRYTLPVSNLVSYTQFLRSNGLTSENRVFALEKAPVPARPFIEIDPTHSPGREATYVGRVRVIDGLPSIIDHDFILTSVVPDISIEVAQTSLYSYFEGELGLTIAYSPKQITVEPANAQDRELLGLTPGAYIAVTSSITHLADTTAFQFSQSRHRADKFKYQDFARRK